MAALGGNPRSNLSLRIDDVLAADSIRALLDCGRSNRIVHVYPVNTPPCVLGSLSPGRPTIDHANRSVAGASTSGQLLQRVSVVGTRGKAQFGVVAADGCFYLLLGRHRRRRSTSAADGSSP